MIIHNVRDSIDNFIGPWEVALLQYEALTAADEGRRIVYRDARGFAEMGRLSSWRDGLVWARFHQGETAAACDKGQVFFALCFASNHPNTPVNYP